VNEKYCEFKQVKNMNYLTALGCFGFVNSFLCYWSLQLSNVLVDFEMSEVPSYLANVNYFMLACQIIFLFITSTSFEKLRISATGFLLGFVVLVGLLCSQTSLGLYFTVLALFHFSEFLVTGLTNPQNLSFDSYMVNHSVAYAVAAVSSWLEHGLLLYFVPSLKQYRVISLAGLAVCCVGEVIRKLAMFHAGRSFNHLVQDRKAEDHVLVTSGIYSLCRHPSYVGWFLWTLGTQIILINPFCLVAYTYVTHMFFKFRIEVEEQNLVFFFGQEYRLYQTKVRTGIPFIEGYVPAKYT
jgi:protein-S-isoprenylcysteine O-methyltransferase